MPLHRSFALVLCPLFSSACSGAAAQDGPPYDPLVLEMKASVPAGGEVFRCRYFILPDEPRDVIRFEHRYTQGSHHVLVYPTNLRGDDVADDLEAFDCSDRADLHQTGLAYGADDEPMGGLSYPAGVGMHLEAGQVLLLEAHYLNASNTDLEATVGVTLHFADEPVPVRAGNLFYYNWAILVAPAPNEATARMRCVVPDDVELLFASSHMHRRGVEFGSWLVGGDLVEPRPLHSTEEWASPEAAVFDPPLSVRAGQRIEFECRYRNDLDRPVTEGESAAEDEMCMFVASYWPQMDVEAENCLIEGSGPVFEGIATCSESLSCVEAAVNEADAQMCYRTTCAASSSALSRFILCAGRHGCTDDACIERECLDEYFACEQAAC